jgi:hypothetical protein
MPRSDFLNYATNNSALCVTKPTEHNPVHSPVIKIDKKAFVRNLPKLNLFLHDPIFLSGLRFKDRHNLTIFIFRFVGLA